MRKLLLIALATASLAAAGPGPQVIAPEDVPVGARGVCVTEMDRGERVEIPVTVLGRLPANTPEGDLVLVRLEAPRFADTGIIAGMSGSPVYIGDKLLGALAYGWAFSNEPIGGVTPFVRMQELPGHPDGQAVPGARPTIVQLREGWRGPDPGRMLVEWLLPGTSHGRRPLPLVLTGSHAATATGGWLGDLWLHLGWHAAGVAGGRTSTSARDRPRAGDMVAAVLVRGDATLAAGGTVTAVDGDRVWAFGHPFLGGGSLEIPLAQAHVVAVLPSIASSFKFFTVGDNQGTIVEDRQHGVIARLGPDVSMLPTEVRWNDRTYRFELLRHPTLLPVLAAYVTATSHAAHGRQLGDQTLHCTVILEFADGSSSALEDTFVGAETPQRASAMVASLIAYFEASPFRCPRVRSLTVDISAEEHVRRAVFEHVTAERKTVRPGETLGVRVRLRTHRQGSATRFLEIEVPQSLDEGRLDLIVADGASWTQYDLTKWPSSPNSFEAELALIDRIVPSTRLVAVLEDVTDGSSLPGGTVAAPPTHVLSWRSLLPATARPVRRMVVASESEEVPWAVSAAVRIPLEVRYRARTDSREETE